MARRKNERGRYSKGWEIRFYASGSEDADRIVRLLEQAGFRAGRPFQKHRFRWIVPLYGREAVAKVRSWSEPLDSAAGRET